MTPQMLLSGNSESAPSEFPAVFILHLALALAVFATA